MSRSNKDNFLVPKTSLGMALAVLSDEQAGKLLKAIYNYEIGNEYSSCDDMVENLFSFIMPKLKEYNDNYDSRCKHLAENGKKGGRPRKNLLVSEETYNNQEKADNVNDNDNDNDVSNETIEENIIKEDPVIIIEEVSADPKKSRSTFTPPTLSDMQQYASEHYPNAPASAIEDCYNYYESNGWMVGKNKMKKWHNALSRWLSQNKSQYNAANLNPYQRRLAAEQQLGQDLAQHCYERKQAELSGTAESDYLPPALRLRKEQNGT